VAPIESYNCALDTDTALLAVTLVVLAAEG
jgi:hypothetical protein